MNHPIDDKPNWSTHNNMSHLLTLGDDEFFKLWWFGMKGFICFKLYGWKHIYIKKIRCWIFNLIQFYKKIYLKNHISLYILIYGFQKKI
jgi:hypothetical protein